MNLHNNCDINISKNTDILGHIKSSRGDMPYQCKQGEKFFSNDYALKNTWAFTMKRRHVNAVRVTRLSRIAVILKAMWKYTLRKSPDNVKKLSQILGIIKYMLWYTLCIITKVTVTKLSQRIVILKDILEFILGINHINAINVTNVFQIIVIL